MPVHHGDFSPNPSRDTSKQKQQEFILALYLKCLTSSFIHLHDTQGAYFSTQSEIPQYMGTKGKIVSSLKISSSYLRVGLQSTMRGGGLLKIFEHQSLQ